MKSVLAAFLLLSSLGGCASDVPLVIREPPADNPTLADAQRNPTAFVNRRVRWGGIIRSVRSVENRTEVDILAKALRSDGRPEAGVVWLGEFLASSDGFLDPAVYSAGREVTAECVNNFETPVAGSLVSNAALPRVRVAWVLEG